MEIVELMIEGLRGYPTMTRIPFAQGLSMWNRIDGREDVVVPVILDLLYPKGGEPTLGALIDPQAAQARAGLHVIGRDGTNFRILRDFRSGKISLLRQGSGGMEPVTSMASEVAQTVTAQVGFPQEDVFRNVYVTCREDMPSQRPDALEITNPNQPAPSASADASRGEESGKNRAWNRPLPPGFEMMASAADRYAHLSDDEKRARIAEITKQLGSFDQVKALEFELDGFQKKGFALDEKLRPLDHLRRELKQNEEFLASMPNYSEVPADLPKEQRRLKQLKFEFDAQSKDFDERIEAYKSQLVRTAGNPQTTSEVIAAAIKEPLVAGGAIAGVIAILVGVAGAYSVDALRWVALLDIPAFGVAVFGAIKFLGDAEGAVRIKAMIAIIEKDRERAQNKHDLEANHIKAMLRRHNLEDGNIDEAIANVKKYNEARHAVEVARNTLNDALAGEDLAVIVSEREALSAKVKELEDELYRAGGFLGNRAELETEVKDLSDVLAGRSTQAPPVEAPMPTPVAAAPTSSPSGPHETSKMLQRIVNHASDLMYSDLDTALTAVAPRAAQYLGGFSDRRYGQVIFGPKGEVSVVDAASGRAIPFSMLTPGDRDIVYLSVKLTIAEVGVKQGRIPLIFVRAFESIPDVKDALIVRMLQFLSGVTQVMLMSKKQGLGAAGGQPVVLP